MIDSRLRRTESRDQLAPTTDPPANAPPFRGAPTLSSYAAAEAYEGVLDRALAAQDAGSVHARLAPLPANNVAMAALVVLSLIVIFVLSAGLISTYVTGFTPQENHLPTS